MEYDIFIPILPWLIGGARIGGTYNYYTGSIGTDASLGCMNQKIFNYRIWIHKEDEHELLKVAAYYGLNSFECQNEADIEIITLEVEEESRDMAREYLQKKAKEFFEG